MPEFSSTCVYFCVVRTSKLSPDDRVVVRVSSDSKEFFRADAVARGVCPLAALREGFNGDRLGVCALRVDGGGGIRSESALPLRASLTLPVRACDIGGDSGKALRSGGVAGLAIFCVVVLFCGKFSLSSMQSSKFGFLGDAKMSIVCCCCSSFLSLGGASHVLLTSLLSASVQNGELGSLWLKRVLSSTRGCS